MKDPPRHPVRIVTAASLFDGHDVTINIIRRMLQDAGAEVIHLGHNRGVMEIVTAALQEGAQGIAVSSYQGGHMEFFKYMKDLLDRFGAPYVKIAGGGGGVIVPEEKRVLENYGITRVYHPEDGRRLGLEGMIHEVMGFCDFDLLEAALTVECSSDPEMPERSLDRALGLMLTAAENNRAAPANLGRCLPQGAPMAPPVIGITGTGGAGKSSLVDELLQRFHYAFPGRRFGVLSVDPTKRRTGGALLGDRIRVNSLALPGTFMRSVASRGSGREISTALPRLLDVCRTSGFDLLFVETSGIGQGDTAITELADLSLYVMTSEFGAQSQLEKIEMLDFADLIAINKADRRGAKDGLRDVRKQYRRSRRLFSNVGDEALPVFLTQASHFNDGGVNALFQSLCTRLAALPHGEGWSLDPGFVAGLHSTERPGIIPPERQNYLAEIVATLRGYKQRTKEDARAASTLGALRQAQEAAPALTGALQAAAEAAAEELSPRDLDQLENWEALQRQYAKDELTYEVRGEHFKQPLVRPSLSGLPIRRVVLPQLSDWGDRLRFLRLENVPGSFPFTAGVFPLKRTAEDPQRQFAGEGTPERTNRRFHYLTKDQPSRRLSVAFDSVTLYGEDPHPRPDIFGKVGESGVSICCLDDMKQLLAGFDLCDPATSVSMTINGPAPMMLAFFMNAAIDQQVERRERDLDRPLVPAEWAEVRAATLRQVRGTVQADILKEDQAQNTCIFSIDFALKMMGDIQEFFIREKVRNFYSVSISGYHIAEAGANPISQLAFTLANGLTYVEYYLSRGMAIDDFAPSLSFFFSNGLDPEYTVLGRVARRIWAIAMRDRYGASERSQKLKYHIQTSGRSLHAQEIAFNDIRTTLQALVALADQCNSLHTNAYDEAITTPTEESVRRAMAIQLIINREFGLAKNENPWQGSFFIEELTELVEEAVLEEFLRLNERGGVLGAMETQYQRGKIQDESLLYERLKHSGELPIVGVNTFIDPATLDPGYQPPAIQLARATPEEKNHQLKQVEKVQKDHAEAARRELEQLKAAALAGKNTFDALLSAARFCTLAQMTQALYEVGGQYRRAL